MPPLCLNGKKTESMFTLHQQNVDLMANLSRFYSFLLKMQVIFSICCNRWCFFPVCKCFLCNLTMPILVNTRSSQSLMSYIQRQGENCLFVIFPEKRWKRASDVHRWQWRSPTRNAYLHSFHHTLSLLVLMSRCTLMNYHSAISLKEHIRIKTLSHRQT